MKMDAKFYGELRKAKDDSIVPEDEWVAFLVKDNAFNAVLPQYLEECKRRGCDAEQIASVERMIARVAEWRASHIDRLKDPDAHDEKLLA